MKYYKNEKGMVLVASLVMLLSLTILGMLAINTALLETRLSSTSKDETQALYLCEAGIHKVKSWLQRPETFTPPAYGNGGVEVLAYIDQTNDSVSPGCLFSAPCTYANTVAANFFERRFGESGSLKHLFVDATSNLSQFVDTNHNGTADAVSPTDGPSDSPALRITNVNYLAGQFQEFAAIGNIVSIAIYPPMGSGTSPTPAPRTLLTVRVVAKTKSGFLKTIEREMKDTIYQPVDSGASAAIQGTWQGNGNVRWGQIKTKGDVQLNSANTPQCDSNSWDASKDKWFSAKVSGAVTWQGAAPAANPCTNDDVTWVRCTAAGSVCCTSYESGGTNIGCGTQAQWEARDLDAAYAPSKDRPYQLFDVQQQVGDAAVTIDTWDKELVKQDAQEQGVYYEAQADGKTVKLNGTGAAIDIGVLLNDTARPSMIYVTVPTGVTLDISATGKFYSRGDLFVDGNVSFGGGGSGENIQVQNPDQFMGLTSGTTALNDINYEGVIYATGTYTSSGSPKIFGGIIAEKGFGSGGNPTIYYDPSLINGRKKGPKSTWGRWREIM